MVRLGTETVARPECDLDSRLFHEYNGLANFKGKYFFQTGTRNKGHNFGSTIQYGTAIHLADCIGSGVSE